MDDQNRGNIHRVAIAQICQSVGYSKIQASSLAVVHDVLDYFLEKFCQQLHAATEHANRTEATFKDLLFCFNNQNICIGSLIGFLKQHKSVPYAMNISQYPSPTNSSLALIDPTGIEEEAPLQIETETFESESIDAMDNEPSIHTW